MSEKPEVCYVREITEEEEAAIKNCVNGALRDKVKAIDFYNFFLFLYFR